MIRVRAGNTYAMPFVVNLGQRNADIVNGHLTPLRRMIPHTVAFTMLAGRYDLIHSMNAVPLFARVPFLITFEDWMPRTPPDLRISSLERVLTRVIASDRCVALIAMSEFARKHLMVQHRLSPHYPKLLKKTEVIYPAVAFEEQAPKKLGDELRLLFVGSDFMRKGLPALILAHYELKRRGVPVRTTVVSSLRWNSKDYIGPKSASLVEHQKRRLLESDIVLLDARPNHEVRQLMREHDFLVLPTLHDTFGFVTLEAMAVGTPVIASNTCAMPEIIRDGDNGFLLPFRTNMIGAWQWLYRKDSPDYDVEYLVETSHMARAMVDQLVAIWHDPARYEAMSLAALEAIVFRFEQTRVRNHLELLYDKAIRG